MRNALIWCAMAAAWGLSLPVASRLIALSSLQPAEQGLAQTIASAGLFIVSVAAGRRLTAKPESPRRGHSQGS